MKPMIILQPNVMSEVDIELLRKNDICVVIAKDPSKVKFVDPIPAASQRTKIEDAAIRLSRKILNRGFWNEDSTRQNMAAVFVDILINGTPLDGSGTQQEQEKQIFDNEKRDELRKLAREEAKAERAALKKK